MSGEFTKQWETKVQRVRSSKFWRQITSVPKGEFVIDSTNPKKDEVKINNSWCIVSNTEFAPDSPAGIGLCDFKQVLKSNFNLSLKTQTDSKNAPYIKFVLHPKECSRWDTRFKLNVSKDKLVVTASSEDSILRACLYLTNYWRLRRNTTIKLGNRLIKPRVDIHLGADFWGGFSTTKAWVDGRETDSNYIELARMGMNAVPIMLYLDEYIDAAPKCFRSLINPKAKENRQKLARLAKQSSKYGVYIFLMANNLKLEPEHQVFKDSPASAGAMQADGAYRALCSSHTQTRKFLADSWTSFFEEIPELGGILTIVGGEGFNHCFMRSVKPDAADCPNCGKRTGSEVVSEFVNEVARNVRSKNQQARLITWPYSAGHWSHDRDQVDFISRLDHENVIFQTEIDKDSTDWRPEGYAKFCWDYSAGCIKIGDRCRNQRNICKNKKINFSCKTEINSSIECLNLPYFPTHYNHLKVWQNSIALKPSAIQSRWLFDGACKSVSEELGYWSIWKSSSDKKKLEDILKLIAERDFGKKAARHVLKAWQLFSEAIRHHPSLDYYVGPYFIGPGQPLVLDSGNYTTGSRWEFNKLKPKSTSAQELDEAFYGNFYWACELDNENDDSSLTEKEKLFYDQPAFEAIVRRGANVGLDIALDELRMMAKLWDKGVEALAAAKKDVPQKCKRRFRQEWTLAMHLANTWHSTANVEEFLRLRNVILNHSGYYAARSGYVRENIRDLERMKKIAENELKIAKEELKLIKGVDFLDLSLRLDMGTASLESIMRAKVEQVSTLLKEELPQWHKEVCTW